MDLSKLGEPDIEIAALRIWVHGRHCEDPEDYWDANWLCVTAHCAEGGGSVRADGTILHLSELATFNAECAKLHETLKGKAELSCMEPNLGVELTASDSRGGIEAEVRLTPDHLTQEHSFRFAIDQSYLPGILKGLRKVLADFPVRGQAK
jgi:hypothetical protein